jgi:ppGpp synthetase/RelA/SpoT-type nucleotidyltranferase
MKKTISKTFIQDKAIKIIRDEYDEYYPKGMRLLDYGKREIGALLNEIMAHLKDYEIIEITGRIKTFPKCRAKLTKDAGIIPEGSTIFKLNDIVGIRISVFPNHYIQDICKMLKRKYPKAISDPQSVPGFYKYFIEPEKIHITHKKIEVQIMPYLLASYWNIEHNLTYKPGDYRPRKRARVELENIHNLVIPMLLTATEQITEIVVRKK